jgi:hypothetical protein
LYLIDDRSIQAANKSDRIGLGGTKRSLVIERDVGGTCVTHVAG